MLNGLGYTNLPISKDIMQKLQNYSWPGNARELRNMLERALMLAQGAPLTISHFPGLITEMPSQAITPKSRKLDDVEDVTHSAGNERVQW